MKHNVDKQTDESGGLSHELNNYVNLAKMISNVFGSTCEIVLHSLKDLDRCIIHIHNGEKTGRALGGPITDKGLARLRQCEQSVEDVMPCYVTTGIDGRRMRSSTVLLRDSAGEPSAMMCLNFDMSTSLEAFAALMTVIPGASEIKPASDKTEIFARDIDELLTQSLHEIRERIYADQSIPVRKKTQQIIYELDNRGIFMIKTATAFVSEKLCISPDTIYMHLRSKQ